MAKSSKPPIYQIKITLKGVRPPIWRRVQVPSNITLADLHEIIQAAMGWFDGHLHEFDVEGQTYGKPMPEYDFDVKNEQRTRLNRLVTGEKFKFSYLYDMGDSWDHDILVEKILPPDPATRYPICIKGKRACPPEDCGGVWGYADLLEILADPDHSDHDEMLEWVGGEFDAEEFDLEATNEQLSQIGV